QKSVVPEIEANAAEGLVEIPGVLQRLVGFIETIHLREHDTAEEPQVGSFGNERLCAVEQSQRAFIPAPEIGSLCLREEGRSLRIELAAGCRLIGPAPGRGQQRSAEHRADDPVRCDVPSEPHLTAPPLSLCAMRPRLRPGDHALLSHEPACWREADPAHQRYHLATSRCANRPWYGHRDRTWTPAQMPIDISPLSVPPARLGVCPQSARSARQSHPDSTPYLPAPPPRPSG